MTAGSLVAALLMLAATLIGKHRTQPLQSMGTVRKPGRSLSPMRLLQFACAVRDPLFQDLVQLPLLRFGFQSLGNGGRNTDQLGRPAGAVPVKLGTDFGPVDRAILLYRPVRFGPHLKLRQKNLRQLLFCPRGRFPTSERRLAEMKRGELR